MAQRSATIKVLCRTDALHDAANMLQWALGHRVQVNEDASDAKMGCLFVFTNIEYYDNDTTLFEQFGFDIIGKIRGVVSWEILTNAEEDNASSANRSTEAEGHEELEVELMHRLCTLPITISIMPRMEGKFAWKCLEASGHAETFAEALEAALTHFTRVFKLIRSELLG
ncbi:MAG TPA: hypothetical protein VFV38_17910 [Ktedonobacteraceae bacterium]|nr:hypothetical protein [Ktedonobacteraceae bacterium]